MIYLLLILLAILLVFVFFINKKDIVSPAFVFTFGFVFQCIWAASFSKIWKLGLHLNTFLVIFLGVFEFAFISYIVKYVFNKRNSKIEASSIKKIKTNSIIEWIFLILNIIISVIYIYYVVKAVDGNFNSFKSITKAISDYDGLLKFSDDYNKVKLPFLVSNLNLFTIYSGYWFLYVLINNYLYEKKFKLSQIFIVISSMCASVLSGSRTPLFFMIIAGILYFIVLYNKKSNYQKIMNKRIIRFLVIFGVIFLSSFLAFANLLGRNVKESPISYLSVYCGAQVKNLDLFLQEKNKNSNEIFGSQTFMNVVKTVGSKLHLKWYKEYRLDLPFRNVDGVDLGNVYTTFYPFIYDFGYVGLVILVALMAFISELIYEYVLKSRFTVIPNLCILIYGVVFGCLLLSFFSNKFYEEIFSMAFVKKVVTWVICTCVFCTLNPLKYIKKSKGCKYEGKC